MVFKKNFFSFTEHIHPKFTYFIQTKDRKTIHFCDFRLQLIRQIIEIYVKPKASTGRPSTGDNLIRLIGRHFPSLISSTSIRQIPQRKCVVYAKTITRAKKN